MSPYSSEIIRQTEMTAPLNSIRQKTKFETTDLTGHDIQFIGDKCFAYSGLVPTSSSEKTLLNFNTGPNIIIAKIRGMVATPATEDDKMRIKIILNDTAVTQQILWSGIAGAFYQSEREVLEMVWPPFTHVKIVGENITDSSSRQLAIVLSGDVQQGSERIQGAI